MKKEISYMSIRCRIEGRWKGEDFIYEDPEGTDGTLCYHDGEEEEGYLTTHFYWTEGTMGSDANRLRFVPLDLLRDEHGGFYIPRYEELCENESITIRRLIPLEGNYPIIVLNEHE